MILMFILIFNQISPLMDTDLPVQVVINFIKEVQKFIDTLRGAAIDPGPAHYKKFAKLLHICAPVLVAIIFYQYLKYLLIFNAYQYEEYVKKRWGYVKKVSKQLKLLIKRYESFYFCYMPMNHGTTVPSSYSLFIAIKEILTNANRPASRVMRANLLQELVYGGHGDTSRDLKLMETSDLFDVVPGEADPLSEYNLDIMKCSREMIIQGVKDFEVMSTVFRVMETVMDDTE